IFIEFPP
ncbi:hypothetical protein D039_2978B, partial [Vibrio parahaemolyticus EKP-028]